MAADELAAFDGVVAIGGDGLFHEVCWLLRVVLRARGVASRHMCSTRARQVVAPCVEQGTELRCCTLGYTCALTTAASPPFKQIINGLLELRSVPTGTTLDQQQWAALQEHLAETAAADAASGAAAAALPGEEQQQQGGAVQPPAAASPQQQQRASLPSCGLPAGARHARGGAAIAHHRTGSVAASMRVGHIPAGSTDAGALLQPHCGCLGVRESGAASGHPHLPSLTPLSFLPGTAVACTLNGTRSAFTAAMHIALGDGCPLDVLRVDQGAAAGGRRKRGASWAMWGARRAADAGARERHSQRFQLQGDMATSNPVAPPPCSAADGAHAFATCMLSYGFMGDVMAESENWRWLGPLRYDVVRLRACACRPCCCVKPNRCDGAALGMRQCAPVRAVVGPLAPRPATQLAPARPAHLLALCPTDWRAHASGQPRLPRAHLLPACRGGAD